MKKNDFILIIIVVCSAFLLWGALFFNQNQGKASVVIKVDGEVTETYELSKNQTVTVNNGTNIIEIKDGIADMIEADCPDQLCVNQRSISKNNESIICLPNKVVIQVISQEDAELDAVTN